MALDLLVLETEVAPGASIEEIHDDDLEFFGYFHVANACSVRESIFTFNAMPHSCFALSDDGTWGSAPSDIQTSTDCGDDIIGLFRRRLSCRNALIEPVEFTAWHDHFVTERPIKVGEVIGPWVINQCVVRHSLTI